MAILWGWPLLCVHSSPASFSLARLPRFSTRAGWGAYVLSSSRHEDICHHGSAYLAAQRRRPRGHIADLRPRCLADLERFFATPAKHAGIFQHSPGEFHGKNFPVLAAWFGGDDVLTPELYRTTAFWAVLPGGAGLRHVGVDKSRLALVGEDDTLPE
jgi:hypothetical protein